MSTIPPPTGEIEPKSWQDGLAPVYIGIFLWVAFFDQIGRRALPLGSLGGAFLGVTAGGVLAYLCLFRAGALWSHRSGQTVETLATATFGVSGAKLIPGLLLGIAQVVLFAIAVGYAVDLTFQGLIQGGLIDPQSLRPGWLGGSPTRPPLFLATALFWAIATALVSLGFTRWIGYLMQFFPIFPALVLALTMVTSLDGLKRFDPTGGLPATPENVRLSCFLTLQWVFAFSALPGVMGADWGLGSRTTRDVRLGGWVGLAFAPAIVSIIALISIAGYQGSLQAPRNVEGVPIVRTLPPRLGPVVRPGLAAAGSPAYTFRAVLTGSFPNRLGALLLGILGLGSLAPAVYASFAFGKRFHAVGPGISRVAWTLMGTAVAWLIVAGGWFDRTEIAFNILGATFAPVAGAFAADYRRHRGVWPGPRRGINPAGVLAWGCGFAVGLAPTIGQALGSDRLAAVPLAAPFAFVTAYVIYEVMSLLRLESRAVEEPANDTEVPGA